MGTIAVFPDSFEVNGARFTTQNVVSLEWLRGLFGNGLRIAHTNRAASKHIIFWSPNFPVLRTSLQQIGFCITESREWRRQEIMMGIVSLLAIALIAVVCTITLYVH